MGEPCGAPAPVRGGVHLIQSLSYECLRHLLMHGRVPPEEIRQEVDLFIRNLNSEAEAGSIVVVEGKRDRLALRSLGFSGKVIMLCHSGSIIDLVDQVNSYNKTILLLDSDREGKSLTAKAAHILQGKAIVDLSYRRNLRLIGKGMIRHVEELSKFSRAWIGQ